jgi:hypothetical protein
MNKGNKRTEHEANNSSPHTAEIMKWCMQEGTDMISLNHDTIRYLRRNNPGIQKFKTDEEGTALKGCFKECSVSDQSVSYCFQQ